MAAKGQTAEKYVFLVRHASRNFDSDPDEKNQSMIAWNPTIASAPRCFCEKGLPLTRAMANRLVDELHGIEVREILHSPHVVSQQTAEVFRHEIEKRTKESPSISPQDMLDPGNPSVSNVVSHLKEVQYESTSGHPAVMVVGHQPDLTRIARGLAKKFLWRSGPPFDSLPLGASEVACLELPTSGPARLRWLLTEKPRVLMADLREKIRSKYDVAKFFLGAFVVNTGFILSSELWDLESVVARYVAYFGFVTTLIALGFTVATLLSYDSLLMPPAFWSEPAGDKPISPLHARPKPWSILRPPSQAHVVLYYEMVHVWSAFFVPALQFALCSVTFFLGALTLDSVERPCLASAGWRCEVCMLAMVSIVAVLAWSIPLIIYRRGRPRLGTED